MSAADVALDVDVGQKIHLDRLYAGSSAGFATAPFHVERETSGFESADLGVGSRFEQFADIAEDVRIGRRIAARRPPDRRLVDDDQFVDVLNTLDPVVFERLFIGVVEFTGNGIPQRGVYQRGFAAAADPRHADHLAERKIDGYIFQVISPRPVYHDVFSIPRAAFFGQFDPPAAGQVIGRDSAGLHNLLQRSGYHDLSAADTGSRPYVHDPVGIADHVFVVFHDNYRIPRVAQCLQTVDQFDIVALMQSDARFVEDIKHVDQFRPDLSRQPDPLALPAGQRTRAAVQRQVAQSDVQQKTKSFADLFQNFVCDLLLFFRKAFFDAFHPEGEFLDTERRQFGDVFSVDFEIERFLA